MSINMPGPVQGYITASNAFDGDALIEWFADDAFVNDARREFWGKDAIRAWLDREIIGVGREDLGVRCVDRVGDREEAGGPALRGELRDQLRRRPGRLGDTPDLFAERGRARELGAGHRVTRSSRWIASSMLL